VCSLIETATSYLQAGLCCLPALLDEKRPAVPGWKTYQKRLPTLKQAQTWFSDSRAICVLTGSVSGNLEMIDFDHCAQLFEPWYAMVAAEDPELASSLVIERSQSAGKHVVYRCQEPVEGNRKLAQRKLQLCSSEPVVIDGRRFVPRRSGDGYEVILTLIETRGEGGLFLCDPSPGYYLESGEMTSVPILTSAQRAILIEAACALSETVPPPTRIPAPMLGEGRPGDDFNDRGDVRALLEKHGWQRVKGGDNEYWRRPGKQSGWSATLRGNQFFVFSSNAIPFEQERSYGPFAVYAMLEHGGDFAAAATALRFEGYGQSSSDTQVDLSQLIPGPVVTEPEKAIAHVDPGPMPAELLRIPGFVSEVMDHCLETAPYPNAALAFCGALSLLAVLAGRKVCDVGNNRTNIYLLALGYSSVGKDWPRKLNTEIMHRVGMISALGEKFASGEGIQDALFITPSMLFQTDEIDGLLQSINKARDARHENIMGTMLTMYSSANTIYPMRRKAGKEAPGVIDQPCLVVYGTAIPTHYYDALSERMLTNGFFARMLIVESGPRAIGGNLDAFHPEPRLVEATPEAQELLADARRMSETEYAKSEAGGDPVGTTVWGRVPENVRKLALLYAISANHQSPMIDAHAVMWATTFMVHQTRRMLFMANSHVSENPFHAECLKFIRKLQDAPNRRLAHSVLLKRMKMDAKTFQEIVTTLEQQGDILTVICPTAGRPQRQYQLLSERNR
jgi:hypothetical protein